jgi:two-component system sensor histidine kinase/response regulator
MPEMDGYTATKVIRHRESMGNAGERRTPIVALTAHAMAGEAGKCLAAGMDDYLAKPVTTDALSAVLERWVVPDELPVGESLDPAVLEELLRDDVVLLGELVSLYVQDAPVRLTAMRDALQRADIPALRREAHTLKGSSSTIGATGVADLCADLEARGDRTDADETTALLTALDREFDQVRASLFALVQRAALQ